MNDLRNHGMNWTQEDKHHLAGMFNRRASIMAMARELGRTEVSISCKLQSLGLTDDRGRRVNATHAFSTPAHKYDAFDRLVTKIALNRDFGLLGPSPYFNISAPTQPQPYPEESVMPFNIKIETKTFINGADAALMSNEDFFALIQRAENELTRLDNIQHKPKALQHAKDELIAEIMNLVSLLDARSCPAPK